MRTSSERADGRKSLIVDSVHAAPSAALLSPSFHNNRPEQVAGWLELPCEIHITS